MNNKTPKALNNQALYDAALEPTSEEQTKLNILLEFHDAANMAIALPLLHDVDKINPYQLDTSAPIISITDEETGREINLLNIRSMSDEQKQKFIDKGALDLSNDLVLKNMVKAIPSDVLNRAIRYFNKQTHNIDKVHIIGDISGINVELGTANLTHRFTEVVDLKQHGKYPFSQTHGKSEYVFWGEQNTQDYKAAIKKDNENGLKSKTFDLDEHEWASNVIISADKDAPEFFEID